MKLENQRNTTQYSSRDNMLDIWTHIIEFGFRSFGLKPRKPPKIPSNFNKWSKESQQKWKTQQIGISQRQQYYDNLFVSREAVVLDSICRKILYLVDAAVSIQPKTISKCKKCKKKLKKAIIICNNLIQELNHIMRTVPSNKNFIVMLQRDIFKEIQLLNEQKQKIKRIKNFLLQKQQKSNS